jgi:phage terminase small subunit
MAENAKKKANRSKAMKAAWKRRKQREAAAGPKKQQDDQPDTKNEPVLLRKKGDLTPKQRAFVQEYLIDLNATQAAKRAGYSEKTAGQIGKENLRKPPIIAAIKAAQDKRTEKVEVSAEWVLGSLVSVANRCMGEEHYNAAAASRALELVGKHIGMFVERKQIDVRDLSKLSDAELQAILDDEIDAATALARHHAGVSTIQ